MTLEIFYFKSENVTWNLDFESENVPKLNENDHLCTSQKLITKEPEFGQIAQFFPATNLA